MQNITKMDQISNWREISPSCSQKSVTCGYWSYTSRTDHIFVKLYFFSVGVLYLFLAGLDHMCTFGHSWPQTFLHNWLQIFVIFKLASHICSHLDSNISPQFPSNICSQLASNICSHCESQLASAIVALPPLHPLLLHTLFWPRWVLNKQPPMTNHVLDLILSIITVSTIAWLSCSATPSSWSPTCSTFRSSSAFQIATQYFSNHIFCETWTFCFGIYIHQTSISFQVFKRCEEEERDVSPKAKVILCKIIIHFFQNIVRFLK